MGNSLEHANKSESLAVWSEEHSKGAYQSLETLSTINPDDATSVPLQTPNLKQTLTSGPHKPNLAVGLMIATNMLHSPSRGVQNREKEVLYVTIKEQNLCIPPTLQNTIIEHMSPGGTPGQSGKESEWTQVTRKGKSKGRGSQSPREISTEQSMKEGNTISSKSHVGDNSEHLSPSSDLVTGLATRVRFIDGLANLPPQPEPISNSEGEQLKHVLKNPVRDDIIQMGSHLSYSLSSSNPGLNAGSYSSSPC